MPLRREVPVGEPPTGTALDDFVLDAASGIDKSLLAELGTCRFQRGDRAVGFSPERRADEKRGGSPDGCFSSRDGGEGVG